MEVIDAWVNNLRREGKGNAGDRHKDSFLGLPREKFSEISTLLLVPNNWLRRGTFYAIM